MKLGGRLFSAMFILIILISSVFFVMSRTYMRSVFERYTSVVKYGQAQQWASLLRFYYNTNGHSWNGVDSFVDNVERSRLSANLFTSHESLAIIDNHQKPIYVIDNAHARRSDILTIGIPVPIVSGGHAVATVYVLDKGLDRLFRLQQKILSSMTKAIVYGAIVTMGAALLLALWLTRILVNPLNQLIRAIREMGKGNLRSTLSIQSSDEFAQVSAAFNQMAAQLSAAEEARRHLVADVAHELRTPLTIMQGQLELIQQGVLKPDVATLLPISDECIRLTRLVEDLHQLSQAEAGVLHLEKSNTDVVTLLERIVDNFQFEAEDRGITLWLTPSQRVLQVNLDARRMTQVFINILGNALRYTPKGGSIRIHISKEDERVQISIADSGAGIPEEHLPNLFNRFYRVDSDRSRAGGGMGLGLAIAKEFVEAHHGSIHVESKVGEGTTFTINLPA